MGSSESGPVATHGTAPTTSLGTYYRIFELNELTFFPALVSINVTVRFNIMPEDAEPNGNAVINVSCGSGSTGKPGLFFGDIKRNSVQAGKWVRTEFSMVITDVDLKKCGTGLQIFTSANGKEVQQLPIKLQILNN